MTLVQQELCDQTQRSAVELLRDLTPGDRLSVNEKQPYTVLSVSCVGKGPDTWQVIGPGYGNYLLKIVGDDNIIVCKADDPFTVHDTVESFTVVERVDEEESLKVKSCKEFDEYPDLKYR